MNGSLARHIKDVIPHVWLDGHNESRKKTQVRSMVGVKNWYLLLAYSTLSPPRWQQQLSPFDLLAWL